MGDVMGGMGFLFSWERSSLHSPHSPVLAIFLQSGCARWCGQGAECVRGVRRREMETACQQGLIRSCFCWLLGRGSQLWELVIRAAAGAA
jgi:hypothetical protein